MCLSDPSDLEPVLTVAVPSLYWVYVPCNLPLLVCFLAGPERQGRRQLLPRGEKSAGAAEITGKALGPAAP